MEEKVNDSRNEIEHQRKRRIAYVIIVTVITVGLMSWSVTISSTNITPVQVYEVIINQFFPGTFDVPYRTSHIVMNTYLPRVLMGLFAGATLAIGGAITQTILRNSLATPYTLGVSSSAAFGASLSILFGFTAVAGRYGTILNAFAFSLIPAMLILFASSRRNMSPASMVLIGVAISYVFSACTTLSQYFGDAEATKAAMFWTVGDLNSVLLEFIPYVAITMVLTLIVTMYMTKDMDALRMGDDTALSLGVNVHRTRIILMILACLSTAIIVSFVGAIGFICLLAPHISRLIGGGNLRFLIPASAITGALLLTVADIISKDLVNPIMLPVGAITAVIGGPVLVYLLYKSRNSVF
ncbi:MAG: iron ABC transporter permease [Candidatus Methanomethylophilaceae archaeon]|nr:iron ABC transporter permease [Candidatus Methanomethylophilaceae archaeon]